MATIRFHGFENSDTFNLTVNGTGPQEFTITVVGGGAGGPFSATMPAGTTATIDLAEANITGVEILTQPAYGRVSVNPDNTLALVLTQETSTAEITFDVRATYSDASTNDRTGTITVDPLLHDEGWGIGDFYLFETDGAGVSVIETGAEHRKLYVSGDPAAWSMADIEAAEGQNFGAHYPTAAAWVEGQSLYGSATHPLDELMGDATWERLTRLKTTSHHLYLERGYTYSSLDILHLDQFGESPLHPLVIGAFGSGARPVLDQYINITIELNNIVLTGLHLTGGFRNANIGHNFLLEDMEFSDEDHVWQGDGADSITGLTFRRSYFHDAFREDPIGVGFPDEWEPNENRKSNLFTAQIKGLLIEDCLADKAGWEEGYDPDDDPDPALPQPPSKFSHVFYLQYVNRDVTVRRNIIARGASAALQFRCGGVLEDNLILDNNQFANVSGGGADDTDNFSLILGNVCTSAGYRTTGVVAGQGNNAVGWENQAYLSAYVDNITCHAADPNNASEVAAKPSIGDAKTENGSSTYDNTKIRNWDADANLDGLNTATLDAATIQLYADEILSASGSTIDDFLSHVRGLNANAYSDTLTAVDAVDWFKTAFEVPTSSTRSVAASLRFIPDARADGARWDNRLNWSSGDLPIAGDDINLGGNQTYYAGTGTLTIGDLTFGGGSLWGSGGRLTVGGTIADAGTITTTRAMQFWFGGTDQDLTLDVEGGRLANTGDVTGDIDLSVSGQGQVILATGGDWAVGAGSITITGSAAQVGFDGEGGAAVSLTLSASSTLNFVADAGGFSTVQAFASGAFATPSVTSTVTLASGSTITVDATGLAAGDYDLIDVDTLTDNGATLPSGVAVVGNKLVLTVS